MSELVSVREYARRRGVSHTAVQKAIKSQRLSKAIVDGKIDPAIADAEWPKDTQEILRDHIPTAKVRASADDEDAKPVDKVSSTYAQSRAAREAYAARLARLDFEERTGKLTETEKVQREAFKVARFTRDSVLNLPDRLAAELAAETNVFKVHARLSEELRKCLESLENSYLESGHGNSPE